VLPLRVPSTFAIALPLLVLVVPCPEILAELENASARVVFCLVEFEAEVLAFILPLLLVPVSFRLPLVVFAVNSLLLPLESLTWFNSCLFLMFSFRTAKARFGLALSKPEFL
jgi:hypothetical protein